MVDRAFVNYEWLYNLDSADVYFVTRLKRNADIEIAQNYFTNDQGDDILSDQDDSVFASFEVDSRRIRFYHQARFHRGNSAYTRCMRWQFRNIFDSLLCQFPSLELYVLVI